MFDDGWFTDPDDEGFVNVIESVFLWTPPALAITDLIVNGTFDRHPDLRIGVVELSAIWVPLYLLMLDGGWDFTSKLNGRAPSPPSLRPSEYFRRQVRVAAFSYEQPPGSRQSPATCSCAAATTRTPRDRRPAGRLRAGRLPARGGARPVRGQRPLPARRLTPVAADSGHDRLEDFCRRLAALGTTLPDDPADPGARADGIRHLARQAVMALQATSSTATRAPASTATRSRGSQWGGPTPTTSTCAGDRPRRDLPRGARGGRAGGVFSLVEGDMHLDELRGVRR